MPQKLRPRLKILFTTGYAPQAIVHDGRLDPGVNLIPKPFTYAALASRISDMLDNRSGADCALLVEDDVLVQMLAIDYLEELGFQVEVAGSATEAIKKARLMNGQFHVAIVDLGLPDRGGDMLVAELRALYPMLPIVIASGYADAAVRDKFSGDSRIAFLRKPYVLDNIQQAVSAMGKGHMTSPGPD